MDRPELVQRILNKEITEAKMYEIIAAVSLCVETLSLEECRYLGERYFGIFHIVKGKVGVCCGSVEGFREVVEADNNRRKSSGEPLIKYDENKILRSIWH